MKLIRDLHAKVQLNSVCLTEVDKSMFNEGPKVEDFVKHYGFSYKRAIGYISRLHIRIWRWYLKEGYRMEPARITRHGRTIIEVKEVN
jgi:hypothetical protein